jgi:hypothetical protein
MKLVIILATWLIAGVGADSVQAQDTTQYQQSQQLLTPTTAAWVGSVTGQNGGLTGGGNGPAFNSATNTLIFGYTNATAMQTITAQAYALQHALDLSNSGIKIGGYNYSWQINNSGMQTGTLTGQVQLKGSGGNILETYIYNYNTPTEGFELKTGTQRFNSDYELLNLQSMSLSFTGQDDRFWAGYWGPQVRQPSLTMNYTVDQCALNPLSSPSCAGYNQVLTSQNLTATTYAINTALNLSGSGVLIHGYRYGYTVNLGASWYGCTATNQDGSCSWYMSTYPYASVATSVRDNTNTLIRPMDIQTYSGTNSTNAYDFSVVFDSSRRIGTMGNFSMGVGTSGNASITNKWSNWQYTPDFCVGNPLYSPTCDGYAEAYKAVQCSANALYDPTCPGYAVAFKAQQCTINALYDPTCPGYAAAYLTYQCSLNPLYSTTCAGYEQAYLNAQCILDSLYSSRCEGYATAYAIKYLVPNIDSNAVNSSLSSTAATKASDPANTAVSRDTANTTVNTDGTISTGVSATGNTTVDSAIAPRTTSTAPTNPSAPVNLTRAPAPEPPTSNDRASGRQEQRAENNSEKGSGERREGGQQAQGGGQQEQKSDQPKTARQEMQAKREAAAKTQAIEKGKNLANEMGKAADMAQQVAVQNVVIQAMGFTPGFDTYNKTVMQDAPMYRPYTIYGNQQTVDNRRLSRGLFGATDNLHNSMVEQQYK